MIDVVSSIQARWIQMDTASKIRASLRVDAILSGVFGVSMLSLAAYFGLFVQCRTAVESFIVHSGAVIVFLLGVKLAVLSWALWSICVIANPSATEK